MSTDVITYPTPSVEVKKISDLTLYANNPRTHTRAQIELIKKSIKKFGFIVPVLIDEKNVVITGHGRIKAAIQLGMTELPTIKITHLSPAQVNAFRLADNYLTDESKWNKDLLKGELALIDITDFDMLKSLNLNMCATELQLDHCAEKGEDGENVGGAYFETSNEVFIQIGSINFTIDQSEETTLAIDLMKTLTDPEKKAVGALMFKAILSYRK